MNATTEWYDVEVVADGVVMIAEAPETLRSNVFVVRGDKAVLVIDTSVGVGDLRGLVETLADQPPRVALTHSHWDHIGNAHQFTDVAIHPHERTPDGRVTIDGVTDEFVDRPTEFVADHTTAGLSFPDGFDPASYRIPPAPDVSVIEDGTTVDLGGRRLELLHLPGHSPGHTGVLDRANGLLFGGDIVHLDRGVYAHFKDSSLPAYLDSLETLLDLRDDGAYDTLLTAHNDPLHGQDLGLLDSLHTGLRAITTGELEPTTIDTSWGAAWQYHIDDSPVLTKPTHP